jgi:hypothetical protein
MYALDLADIADQISDLPLATAIRTGQSWHWLFPTVETLHVIAITTVFGSIILLDLRLLGWMETRSPVSRYVRELLPLTWIAFGLAVTTGALLFIANAPKYVFLLQFRLKIVFIVLAGINMLIFHLGAYRRVGDWNIQSPPPVSARVAGLASIICWTAVVFLGRWIGFVV